MDAAEFEALLHSLRDRLQAVAWRVTGREAEALDALQEALVRMYRGRAGWDRRAAFSTWAHRVVVRCAIDQVRARGRLPAVSIDQNGIEDVPDLRASEAADPMVQAEDAALVRDALHRLPERQRLVLVLRHYEDLPLAEIADLLGCAVGTVKATLCQGLRNLAGGRLYYRFENPKVRTVTVHLGGPRALLLAGADAQCGPFFAARLRPELPAAPDVAGAPRAVFLVDTSLSSNPERFNVWLRLLRAILDRNRGSLREFAVLFFNLESFWWKEAWTPNTPENVAALAAFADNLALEGATDLGTALAAAAAPPWDTQAADPRGARDFFLLSDGEPTWGESDPYALSARLKAAPAGALFAYTTGLAGTDTRLLAHLARESGGAVFSVVGEPEIAAAATAHRAPPWRIAGLALAGTTDLLLAGRPDSLYPGQDLALVGRGAPASGAELALTLERAGARQVVATRFDHVLASDLAPRAYGQVATAQLEDCGRATEPVAQAYATHFRVTGRSSSLLMLESEADYARFGLKPEEEEKLVRVVPAAAVVSQALQVAGAGLGNAKAAFLTWLTTMQGLPGAGFALDPAVRATLERMPAAAFTVVPPALVCRQHGWAGVPGAIQEQLAARHLDYDALTAEAARRLTAHGPADALKALSSLIESAPGDAVLARDVGFSALEWGLGAQAYHLFRRVAAARPYEPVTYRALAQCLADGKSADLALAWYEVALAGRWDPRFGSFRRIAGCDYLRFLRRVAAGELATSVPDFVAARLPVVAQEFDAGPADLIVGITWNTDATDVDLHVLEPTGEECMYNHPQTRIGGELSPDVTQGYGPERYVLKRAVPGEYRISVHYFASDRNRASVRTKVFATILEGAGTPNERVTHRVIALAEGKEQHDVATVVRR